MRNQRGASMLALLIALAVIGLIAWFVIGRSAGDGVNRLAEMGVELDDTKQQRTLADMKAIGDAIRLMQADTGAPPATLAELETGGYLAAVPMVDGWGNALAYTTSRGSFELRSLGADGRMGPAAPDDWVSGSHACDLVLENGQFTQAPSGR